ncbi:MAG: glycosyltransferase family 4 protein [Chloroflexota bacterium]|nr:glycosyltransferase family 4 protein [Chloroflexota bacterium]MBI5704978.1 glycosyltransferase family 4 protein [Chloroflexota bacterium]
MSPVIFFFILALLSCLGVWLLRRYAERRQILDRPTERSSHSLPTPRGGGLAIVLLVTGAGLWSMSEADWMRSLVYLLCGLVIAFLGWRDDLHSLSPHVRFAVQGLVAAVSIAALGYFDSVTIPLFGKLQLGAAGILITFLWIVGLTNAYNFMDGIDGMAGGVAFAAGLGWALLTANIAYLANSFVFWIALAIAASSLGFLVHNWQPAKIFMGDVASTFLGYTFAVMPLLASDEEGDALMLGTLLLWTFIMDAGVTFIRRAVRRENVFAAHRTHLYQRLVIGGYSHAQVSILYIVLTLVALRLASAWSNGDQLASAFILFGLPLTYYMLNRHANTLLNTKDTKGAKDS